MKVISDENFAERIKKSRNTRTIFFENLIFFLSFLTKLSGLEKREFNEHVFVYLVSSDRIKHKTYSNKRVKTTRSTS